jgi:hypothetical protein
MARTAESLLRTAAAAALCAHRPPPVAETGAGLVAIKVATAASAWLSDGEVGFLTIGRLPFGPRQRRANEPPMNRPFVIRTGGRERKHIAIGIRAGRRRLRLDLRFQVVVPGSVCGHRLVGSHRLFAGLDLFYSHSRAENTLGRLAANRVAALAARRRHACSLVLVIRITGGAARLFHLIFNHRHHRVIGNAALARTIVVQNVTEPKPALLHQNFSGAVPFRWVWGKV